MTRREVDDLIRPQVRALSAYHVPDASGLIKLDAMENPYRWPEEMVAEWLEELRTAPLNRYPDPAAAALKTALRRASGVPEGAELLLGNGSDEIIQIILMAVAGPDVTVLAPEPTFVMYRQIAVSLGLRFAGVPLRAGDFGLDMDAMRAALRQYRPAVVFLAYPNNPTGNLFDAADIRLLLDETPGLVVLDEAYAPFAEASFMDALPEYDHLLVMRTLSKLGLAGLRLGFLAGAPRWVEQFEKLRLPYNINVLTQLSATFALERAEVFAAQTARIRRSRQELFLALQSIPALSVYPSRANFLLFRLHDRPAAEVFAALRDAGVLVKFFAAEAGPLAECLRVTVGTCEENTVFLSALRKVLHASDWPPLS
jgi:histidinol-phosphate aminotransferase